MKTYQNGRNTGEGVATVKKMVHDLVPLFKSDSHDFFVVTYSPVFSLRHGFKVELFDGVHRAVIAKACGVKTIKCMISKSLGLDRG